MSQAVYGFKNQNPSTESDPPAHGICSAMLWGHKAALNPAYVAGAELLGGHKASCWRHIRDNKQQNQSPVTEAQGKVQVTCLVMARVRLD